MPDGTELEIGPGDVFEAPPGHDAWVVGNEPWISADFEAMRSYGQPADERQERSLVSILVSDIVGSTALADRLGDATWRKLFGQHNERAQAAVDRYRGRVVKWTGDGMLALFDGAERAVRAAVLLRSRLGELDLHVRQGIHSGEVEVSPSDARGIAVRATARIADLAHPAEIWVSGTVRDLLDGSDFDFQKRGQHELKGLHGSRALYAIGADPIARESTHFGG